MEVEKKDAKAKREATMEEEKEEAKSRRESEEEKEMKRMMIADEVEVTMTRAQREAEEVWRGVLESTLKEEDEANMLVKSIVEQEAESELRAKASK
ncbi:hypothetical protein E2562_038123 [Oryza meyeriana var. granulata]|uniref:Uncharacterized protein n=1 Tax=Oryza meyeriana var. granulata TaxID=110450 RepID=A0A6G1F272_9ORYZ|nr:hypothetical protein E2562_038123 [Oryza meyeriana var. granulata]